MSGIDPRLLRDERIEALEAYQALSKARIAELEAENARLRDLGYGVERERDEARAACAALRRQIVTLGVVPCL